MLSPPSSLDSRLTDSATQPLSPPPLHGGRLAVAAQHYQRPIEQWLDLSTGINPAPYPVEDIPASAFQRLPEDDDALMEQAGAYYGTNLLLPLPGSQAAIQLLPRLRRHSRVGILSPAYQEHAYHWRLHGHEVFEIQYQDISQQLSSLDVLVVINPNNPTGDFIEPERLRVWQRQLAVRRGWLIVDEAFVDTRPQYSLIQGDPDSGLVVLRSLGKFFGLAGIRCGFVHGHKEILAPMSRLLGPWPLSGPTRHIAAQALADPHWQGQTQQRLQAHAQRLRRSLVDWGRAANIDAALLSGCDFFQTMQLTRPEEAQRLYDQLAEHGILTRLLREHRLIRLGLPSTEPEWQRLQQVLASV